MRILTICIAVILPLTASAFAITIEQVQASPPNFDVYLYDDKSELSGIKTEDISAELGGLALNCTDISLSEQGIFYFFMLDISASMPEAHFAAAKNAVLNTYSGLREQDKLALITFGSEVTLLLEGHENKDDVTSSISSLNCDDEKTMFYTAMNKLIELAPQTEDMRRIAVVISDGIDDSDAALTQEQLEEKLINSGISVYALCIDSADETSIGSFRSFIRISGGELYTYGPESADAVFSKLLSRLGNSLRVKLVSFGAVPEGENLTLNMKIGNYGSVSAELSPGDWIADEKPPYVKSAVYIPGAQTLNIVFSEPVAGGDALDNYRLTDNSDKALIISSVVYSSAASDKVFLSFDAPPPEGVYTLSVSGIADISPNANIMPAYSSSVHLLTGVSDKNSSPISEELLKYLLLGILALATIIGAIFAILRLSNKDSVADKEKKKQHKKKKSKENKNQSGMFIFMDADKTDKSDEK